MPRPAKSASIIKLEKNKDHRTKREIASRERAEKALLTGKMMLETAEVRNDKVAHLEFLRLKPLLKAIDKFDEIYGAPVRRYCLNKSKLNDIDVAFKLYTLAEIVTMFPFRSHIFPFAEEPSIVSVKLV